jgi:hypothetical protein
VHVQLDVTWTRDTTSLAFAMSGLMLAAGRLSRSPTYAEAGAVEPTTPRSKMGRYAGTPAQVA